jgi:hypothetical protein
MKPPWLLPSAIELLRPAYRPAITGQRLGLQAGGKISVRFEGDQGGARGLFELPLLGRPIAQP